MLHILYKGIIIGLITGMPMGPIGALCLRTTLANGALFGFAAGLGSCVADSLYASVAALGLTYISKFFARFQQELRFFGGLILVFSGIHIVLSPKKDSKEIPSGKTLIKSFLSTFAVALANPATIFSFLFVFASYGSKNIGHGITARIILILGVFCGSFLWWLLLILAAGKFHNHLSGHKMTTVNKVLGGIIIFSGIIFVLSMSNYKRLLHPPYLHSKLFELILKIKPRRPFR